MSGASGSIPSYPMENSCKRLSFSTVLMKPELSVLASLAVGDKLKIEVNPTRGIVATWNGSVVGEIVVPNNVIDQLLNCIDGGTSYVGTIISLDQNEGVCEIRVVAI